MYPQNYFSIWPAFPRNNKIFVAMSFDGAFDKRWKEVIEPAIRSIAINDAPLEPNRVDTRTISNSILTEIEDGIANDRLIFSDISTIGKIDNRPMRNGNVMYEIGLAHAVRQPEEVLIFRSDEDDLLFDLANIRINKYQPDESPKEAYKKIQDAILESLKEIDLRKNLAVKIAAESLSYEAYWLLVKANHHDGLVPDENLTMGQVLRSSSKNVWLNRLLEIKALETRIEPASLDMIKSDVKYQQIFRYKHTPFGTALLEYIFQQHQLTPEIIEYLDSKFNSD